MPRIALHKHARLLIGSSLAIVLLAGGVAFAVGTIPGEDGVIHGCYNNRTGVLRVIDPTAKSCTDKENSLFWNQQGVPGSDGADGTNGTNGVPGEPGADGAPGTEGAPGTDGKTILSGASVPDDTLGTEGDFYLDDSTSTLYGPKDLNG